MPKQTRPLDRVKKSAFSCEVCRAKKIKCDGQQPSCERCRSRDETCRYRLNPTLSYTSRLEARIKDLEAQLLQQSYSAQGLSNGAGLGSRTVSSSAEADDASRIPSFERLKINHRGQVSFHGPTSLLNLPLSSSNQAPPAIASGGNSGGTATNSDSPEWNRDQLVTNAWIQKAAETLSNASEPFHDLLQYLLDFHWTWIQPLFNFVYRPAFTRDLNAFGPYYSHTLLSAIISHAARWCHVDQNISRALEPYENGETFSQNARTLLHDDLRNGRHDIPTVQALLLVSAQACGKGDWTEAWMYSGIAFRLVEDLGINIDARKYAGSAVAFSEEDVEIRNRLFWSCYFWDKMISLYLGRCPAIQYSNVSPPQVMMDDSAEYERWIPHGIEFSAVDGDEYPITQAYSVSAFLWATKLAEILNALLVEVYNPLVDSKHENQMQSLQIQKSALHEWYSALPDGLKLRPRALPQHCPPSHIVTLNCLYFTINILIHRPMVLSRSYATSHSDRVTTGEALKPCLESACAISVIFDLFVKSFGYGHCVMALSYSLYSAASIFLLQAQTTEPIGFETLQKLRHCILTLEKVSTVNAVLKRGLHLLRTEIRKLGIDFDSDSEGQSADAMESESMEIESGRDGTRDYINLITLAPTLESTYDLHMYRTGSN